MVTFKVTVLPLPINSTDAPHVLEELPAIILTTPLLGVAVPESVGNEVALPALVAFIVNVLVVPTTVIPVPAVIFILPAEGDIAPAASATSQ